MALASSFRERFSQRSRAILPRKPKSKPPGRSTPMMPGLTSLGSKSALTVAQIARPIAILEAFDNPRPGRDYEVKFVFPEFTSVCPVTGQPDFATITLAYVPDRLCVEMKSLKPYYFAYRNKRIFYEAVVNTILDDLVGKLKPRRMTVIGDFAVRGGTAGTVTASYSIAN